MVRVAAASLLVLAAACGETASAVHELAPEAASQYATAYISAVVATSEADLEGGAREHVIIANNWDHRTDMGGWWIEDADGNRLPLGTGRQIDPDAQLRVYTSCGEDTGESVFVCHDEEVLDDDGDVLTLRDSAGGEVARFAYGTEAG